MTRNNCLKCVCVSIEWMFSSITIDVMWARKYTGNTFLKPSTVLQYFLRFVRIGICPATQHHIPDDLNPVQHNCENLKFWMGLTQLILHYREFIEKDLLDFAQNYPGIVIYVKPRRHHSPHLVAEYCKFYFE